MRKDEGLTADVQEHWRDYARRINPKERTDTITHLENWIKVHPYRSYGRKDVYPGGREGWETGELQSDNTINIDDECWLGDVFMYSHFMTPKDDGAIILWHRGGDVRGNYEDPEVWVGDFEGFMQEQNYCEWYSPEGFLTWNSIFDQGFMWALQMLGSFSGDVRLSDVVYKAIVEDPKIAFSPIDAGIFKNERAFPPEVVRAVREYARCSSGV